MSWGIAETASEIEKIKSESADYLNGLNSCGVIAWDTYNYAFDFYADLLMKAYKQGEKDARQKPCEDPRADVYYLAEKIGIHRLYALVVALRGEPEPCEDAVSRQKLLDEYSRLKENWNNTDNAVDKCISVLKDLPSAQPGPQWVLCSERLPKDLEEVNVTWVNHSPEPYYDFTKDKPFTASAVYYGGKWYWYSSVCADILAEYGKNETDEIDGAIEITAWMPLPEPYKLKRYET